MVGSSLGPPGVTRVAKGGAKLATLMLFVTRVALILKKSGYFLLLLLLLLHISISFLSLFVLQAQQCSTQSKHV